MLRRKFPLAIVMLSARSASNDYVPGQASEAYSPWWRDRKQWVRGRGRAMLLQRETMKCFGKSEETKRRTVVRTPSILLLAKLLLVGQKLSVKWHQQKQLRETDFSTLPLDLCRPQPTCYGVCCELNCVHFPPPKWCWTPKPSCLLIWT